MKEISEMTPEEVYKGFINSPHNNDITYGEFIAILLQKGEIKLNKALEFLAYLPKGKQW